MKTNRRKYRTFSRHGDFLFTKREANKRNRKDVKKMLTNIAQYIIISISKEREVIQMKKYYRVTVKVDATYDIKANTEDEAIDKAYDYMIEGYSPEFETEEIDEEEYCGA